MVARVNEGLGGAQGAVGVASSISLPVYQRVVRVASLLFLFAAMVVEVYVGGDITLVIVLLALAGFVILLFQDVLPRGSLGRWRLPIEAAVVIVVLTLLLALTGGHHSPFFFGYVLFLGVAALWSSGIGGPPLLAVVTSASYIAGVLLAFNNLPMNAADIGRVAFNLVALSLVTYVAAIVGREQRRARDDALRLSRFDSLTGLHSRDYFMTLLEQEILRAGRSGRPFALLMLDLDGLKAANDRFGHASGDQLLRSVADALSGDIRATDLAARYGGDEFVVFLPETDLAGAMLVADKVRIDIARLALPHNGQVIRTSVSVGLVTYPEDGRSSTELMRRADLAMYEAKRRGRDQVVRFARETPVPMGPAPAPVSGEQSAAAESPAAGAPSPPPPAPDTVPAPVPSPSAGVIAVGSYPEIGVESEPGPVFGQPIASSRQPQFAPPPSLPDNTLRGDVPAESPGRPPWESRPS
ncbi:MAG: GGDEF domain-containing protein [Chloroflexota bacterium]